MFYLPILRGPYSKTKPTDWIGEAPLAYLTRAEVVEDIFSGQIDPPPTRVLEISEAAGTVRDVTADIADEVGELTLNAPLDMYERHELAGWLDSHGAAYNKLKVRA